MVLMSTQSAPPATLSEWLAQILDEDEALAKAATPGPWKWQDPGPPHKMALLGDNGRLMVVPSRTPDVWPNVSDARFMEANHPAAVLARIAADRQILTLHRMTDWMSPAKLGCEICHEDYSWGPDVVEGPCVTVRLLASTYADRPGFREEWRPDVP